MVKTFQAAAGEMNVIFNALHGEGGSFSVRSSLDGRTLFTFSFGSGTTVTVDNIIQANDYSRHPLLPEHGDFLTALLHSGALKYKKYDETRLLLESTLRETLSQRFRTTAVCLDTSCFVDAVYSNLIQSLDPDVFQGCFFPVAIGVKNEIYRNRDKKTRSDDLVDVRKARENGFKPGIHRPKARLFEMANAEQKRLLSYLPSTLLDGSTGDPGILSTFRSFARERNMEIVFITGDNNQADEARTLGFKVVQYFKSPYTPRTLVLDRWETLGRLLHVMSVMFVSINIDELFKMNGCWPGCQASVELNQYILTPVSYIVDDAYADWQLLREGMIR